MADVIILENDEPPYSLDNYPGGALNAINPIATDFAVATIGSPVGLMQPFVAQCGLIRFTSVAFDATGSSVTAPVLNVRINVMPGNYKGIAAVPMGQ